jgi:uncharacterized protein YndB with AHSA1/START domain
MVAATLGYAQRIDLQADIERVWQALTEPEHLAEWYAPQARVEAREGGLFHALHDGRLERQAHIDLFLPPRRLRLVYMPLASLPDDGVVVEDFLLDREPLSARAQGHGALTVLRVLGSGIPDTAAWKATYRSLRRGWESALPRLKVLLERPLECSPPRFDRLTGR